MLLFIRHWTKLFMSSYPHKNLKYYVISPMNL